MPHGHLLSVLHLYGVGTKLIQWLPDFLRGRTFSVKVHDELSSIGHASVGCPQGTVCDGLLFILFIDRLKCIIPEKIDFSIYADDVKFTCPIRNESDNSQLQGTLDEFYA